MNSIANPIFEHKQPQQLSSTDSTIATEPTAADSYTKDSSKDKAKKRKRTTRACDQCNQLRTKCDGKQPCAHCIDLKLECDYLRVPQKRGKASQTYLESASRRAVQKEQMKAMPNGLNVGTGSGSSNSSSPQIPGLHPGLGVSMISHPDSSNSYAHPSLPFSSNTNNTDVNRNNEGFRLHSSMTGHFHQNGSSGQKDIQSRSSNSTGNPQTEAFTIHHHQPDELDTTFSPLPGDSHQHGLHGETAYSPLLGSGENIFNSQLSENSWFLPALVAANDTNSNNTNTSPNNTNNQQIYRHQTTNPMYSQNNNPIQLVHNEGSNNHPPILGHERRTDNVALDTKAPAARFNQSETSTSHNLRYPVLAPIADKMATALTIPLAEDLLETYFTHSTHVLAYLVRKYSILSLTNPRKTSPALLYAILLVAAHHSDNPMITGTPQSRQLVISKLTDLTIANVTTTTNTSAAGTLDDVITYVQLGTVVSASEFKGSSLRWWGLAWTLAKELNLNQEIPGDDPETREEQRRTWWLLYMVDRHLGLCYNRPLIILDSESTEIYRPVDEDEWQSDVAMVPPELDTSRMKGICYVVAGQGIYGYFLPLMSILGTLIEIHHLEQNPSLPSNEVCQQLRASVRSYLDRFSTSLKNWNPTPCQKAYGNAWRDYAFQLVNVFHILCTVSWDPMELLKSSDKLMTSPEFAKVTSHAISAAKYIRRVLTVDPDLMLMPFFLGIYLLQGSFVLLAIVDRVESEASQDVFSACETIVHAHEVCIVTLNTEYQRNFRRVMRSTMSLLSSDQTQPQASPSQSGGQKHTPSSISSLSPTNPSALVGKDEKLSEKEEARRRCQVVLGLYRWIAGGHGLAV